MNRLAFHITVVAFAVIITIGIAAFVLARSEEWGSLTLFIFMSGTIGGIANNIRRLSRLPIDHGPDMDRQTEYLVRLQIYLSPLIGGTFGVVLYIVFMSGILQGALFPEFAVDGPFVSTVQFANEALPAANIDVAKALFWAFIAGFAEGFVPNILDRVVQQAEEQDGTRTESADAPPAQVAQGVDASTGEQPDAAVPEERAPKKSKRS